MERCSLWIVIALAGAGCGSRTELDGSFERVVPAPGPSCGEEGDCGGELFGRWKAVESCVDLSFVGALLPCQEIALLEQAPRISGQKSYSKDGRYSSSLTYSGSVRIFVPESCADPSAEASSCRELEQALELRGALLVSEVDCAGTDGGCTCEVSLIPFENESSGTFSAVDGQLREESGQKGGYCVDGDTLRLSQGSGEQLVFTKD